MRNRLWIVLPLMTLAACTSGCGVMDWSPDGKKLVTAWPSVGDATVLRVVDMQTGQSRVLPDSRGAMSPRWSPDGRWIAFTREVGGSQVAHLHDVHSGQTNLIPGASYCGIFEWREDSARLLVCTPDVARCYAMPDAVPTWEAELPANARGVTHAAWIRDTDSVALSAGGDVWLIEGAQVTRLTTTGDVLAFAVRNAGKEIVWARASRNPRYILLSLYAMPLKQRSSHRLPLPYRVAEINPSPRTPIESVALVAFSPDGKRLAIMCSFAPSKRGRGSDDVGVYVMGLDGRNVRKVYPAARDAHPRVRPVLPGGDASRAPAGAMAFSPDSRRLSILIGGGTHAELYVCNADGTGGRSVMTCSRPNTPR